MIGTTHFTNAVIERRELSSTAIIRACLPTGSGIPPMCDWPDDIASALGGHIYMIEGGHRFDGKPIKPLNYQEIDRVIVDIQHKGIEAIAIAAAFSPAEASHEKQIAQRIQAAMPRAAIATRIVHREVTVVHTNKARAAMKRVRMSAPLWLIREATNPDPSELIK